MQLKYAGVFQNSTLFIVSCRIIAGKTAGKRPQGRPRLRWKDNIKTDLKLDGRVWTGLIWLMIGTSGGLL
jgi:hypothetical protein